MSVTYFQREVWAKKIQDALEMKCRLIHNCTRDYEGDCEYAKTVRILGVGDPSVSGYHGTVDYENMSDVAQFLPIDFAEYFAFKVDDIDKAQSKPGLPEKYQQKSSSRLAQRRDINIGRLVAGKCISTMNEEKATYTKTTDNDVKLYKDYFIQKTDGDGNTLYKRVSKPVKANISSYYEITSGDYKTGAKNSNTATAKTQTAIKNAIDTGFVELNKRNCEDGINMEVDPATYMEFRNNLVELSTNNPEMIRQGKVGMYNNAPVTMSNAIYTDDSYKYCMLRTKNAIAFAGQINKVESMRLENSFSDGIRGLDTYGMNIISQDELQVVKIPV